MEGRFHGFRRVLKRALLALLAAALIGVFYVAVVMGQPQKREEAREEKGPAAVLTEMEAPVIVSDDRAIMVLDEVFPAPVMYLGSNSLEFVAGDCSDVRTAEGNARVVTLTWQTRELEMLTVKSVYPADALAALEDGYALTGLTRDTMAGMRYVAMRGEQGFRMHAQGDEALYVFYGPSEAEAAQVDAWTNLLQLYRPEGI